MRIRDVSKGLMNKKGYKNTTTVHIITLLYCICRFKLVHDKHQSKIICCSSTHFVFRYLDVEMKVVEQPAQQNKMSLEGSKAQLTEQIP